MRILVVCDEGNNRAVTIAQKLKYWHHETIPIGLNHTEEDTRAMLAQWADSIIIVEPRMFNRFSVWLDKVELWDTGPDVYPRPFNQKLLKRVQQLMSEHADEYKN